MKIKTIENDIKFLRQVSKEVNLNDDLSSEIQELEKYTLEANCFATAAVQLGYDNRIVYVRCSDYTKYDEEDYNEKEILINPVITKCEGLTTFWEACLSCMDNTAIVCRPYKINIIYYDANGNKKEKIVTGFPATVLSHEYDHLDGILHMDKGLETLVLNEDERIKFRKKHGYEIYETKGDFESLVLKYSYDNKIKKLIKNK